MNPETETEVVPVGRFADLLPGDVVVDTDRTYDGDLVRVRREVPAAPEFEHASGTPGTAVIGGDPEPVWYIRRETASGKFEEAYVDVLGYAHLDSEVSFFIPSVVLDPEDARKKIYEAIRVSRANNGAQSEVQYQNNVAQTVMSALGIEVK